MLKSRFFDLAHSKAVITDYLYLEETPNKGFLPHWGPHGNSWIAATTLQP